jgi:NDP-sugar pyrophosphorylase family protein
MQAVILAGGLGSRLRPYTITLPKPLLPVGNYAILEVIIRQLKKEGFSEVVLSTGYLAEHIRAFCRDGNQWGIKIRYVHEEKPLNTAGALKLIEGLDEDFLVMNGDILTTLSFSDFFSTHKDKGAMATIASKIRESMIDFGVLESGSDGMLDSYMEKPVYKYLVSMGVYMISREAVDLIKDGEAIGMPDLFLRIKDTGQKVYCHETSSYWLDIGRQDDFETAQTEFESHLETFLGTDEQ